MALNYLVCADWICSLTRAILSFVRCQVYEYIACCYVMYRWCCLHFDSKKFVQLSNPRLWYILDFQCIIYDEDCVCAVYSCWQRHQMPDWLAAWHMVRNVTLKITCSTAISTGRNCRTAKYNHLSSLMLSVYIMMSSELFILSCNLIISSFLLLFYDPFTHLLHCECDSNWHSEALF